MEWEAIVVILIITSMLASLIFELLPPELTVLTAMLLVWNLGIITIDDALGGFANEGMITVGALFVVVKGVEKSGVIDRIAQHVFGSKTSKSMALLRMCLLVFVMSAFFNNTPIVALFLPIVRGWARSRDFAPSKFLIPLSYVTVAGGLLSVIGTSTNLVVQGLLKEDDKEEFGFFDPGIIAAPVGVIAIIYLATVGQRLLPENKGGMLRAVRDRTNELITEAEVLETFPYVGKPVDEMLVKMHIDSSALLKIRRPCQVIGRVPKQNASAFSSSSTGAPGAEGLELVNRSELHLDRSDKEYVKRTQGFWYPQKEGADESKTETSDVVGKDSFTTTTNDVEAGGRRERDITEIQILIEHPHQESEHQRVPRTELISVKKDDQSAHYFDIFPVPDGEVVHNGDILFFTQPQALMKNQNKQVMEGLRVIDANVFELAGFGTDLAELAVSDSNPYLGRTLYNSDFASHYNVSILAIRARGSDDDAEVQQLRNVPLRAGDTVLVVASEATLTNLKSSRDFFVVTRVGSVPVIPKPWDYVACLVFVAMLILATLEIVPIVQGAMATMMIMVLGGWVAPTEAVKSIDFRLLTLIASSLGLAKSIQTSGLDDEIGSLVKSANMPTLATIFVVYLVTMLISEIITNNAAAALSLPMALKIAEKLDISYKPLAMTVMVAASAAFSTPIGYQTHIMVWAPGGYKFLDFTKVGLPLDIIFMVCSCLLIPLVWKP